MPITCNFTTFLLLFTIIATSQIVTDGFSVRGKLPNFGHELSTLSTISTGGRCTPFLSYSSKCFMSGIIDARFSKDGQEENYDNNDGQSGNGNSLPSASKSLLEASLQMDPEWKDIAIEFVDPQSPGKNKYINCHMAFVMETEGVTYAIGTPCDTQVAVFSEGETGDQVIGQGSFFIDPDDDENLELMEMAAAEFNKQFGEESQIIFKRTPRTLTVQGNIDAITGDWKKLQEMDQSLIPNNLLLKEDSTKSTEDDIFFDNFFRQELGANYKEEFLLDGDEEMDKQAEEMMKLFNIPGFGTEADDDEGMTKMLDDIFSGTDLKGSDDGEKNGTVETALRLVGFKGPDGKAYSLVQLLQPMVLVAKEDSNLGPLQRMLLTPEEAESIIPRLEMEIKRELGESDSSFDP